jgi:catalase
VSGASTYYSTTLLRDTIKLSSVLLDVRLVDNIVYSLGKTKKAIQKRMVVNLMKADAELGKHMVEGMIL